jgi:hypothetical protein
LGKKNFFPNCVFVTKLFFKFIFTVELSHFLGHKIQKIMFVQKTFWKKDFLEKNKKNISEKNLEKKYILWNFCHTKK